jgi:hypothetical protein
VVIARTRVRPAFADPLVLCRDTPNAREAACQPYLIGYRMTKPFKRLSKARCYVMQPRFPVDMDIRQCRGIGVHGLVLKSGRYRTAETGTPEACISANLGSRFRRGY